MKKILYINGNPQAEDLSYSRRVGNYWIEQKAKISDTSIEVFNIYEEYVPLIDQDVLSAWAELRNGLDFSQLSQEQQVKVGRMGQILAKFKEADEYVFVTPLWNFSLPPMLKAFIDNVLIAGETFKYTDQGPVGLLEGKEATIILASGGVFSQGPAAGMEHGVNYLETVLGFMGIPSPKVLRVEGLAIPGKTPEEHLNPVYKQVDDLLSADLV